MIVLDASVILKWIFGEEGEEISKQYRDRHVSGEEIIAVHDLFFYEIANVLATKTRLKTKDAIMAFRMLWDFDLEIFNLGGKKFIMGIAMSKRYGITFYDAAYICLARRLKCHYVTADRKLYEKVRELKEVKLL